MRSLHPWPTFPPDLDPPATRSLSLLFFLQEWIDARQYLETIQWSSSKEAPKILERLLLFGLHTPFSQKGGFLDRLCFYSEILLQVSKGAQEKLTQVLDSMQAKIVRMRNSGVHGISELTSLKGLFRSLFSSLTPFLQESKTDENLLIYLAENKKTLNHFLGIQHIEKLLQSFFPTGSSHVRAVICEGFTKRGFLNFLQEKEPLIEQIAW